VLHTSVISCAIDTKALNVWVSKIKIPPLFDFGRITDQDTAALDHGVYDIKLRFDEPVDEPTLEIIYPQRP